MKILTIKNWNFGNYMENDDEMNDWEFNKVNFNEIKDIKEEKEQTQ